MIFVYFFISVVLSYSVLGAKNNAHIFCAEVLETAAIYKAAVFDYNDKKGNTIDGE